MKILIVDDDPGMLNALRVGLKSAGHQSATARNGRQALDILASSLDDEEPFDLLVTDLRMPKMDGLELIRVSREICPELQCILMTAYGEDAVRRKVESFNRCAYVEKPFTPERFLELIQEMTRT
ncbi:MAG: response regulator [Thermodesulfobacteriota bacterium]